MVRFYRDSALFPGGSFHPPDPFTSGMAFGQGSNFEPGEVGEEGIQAGAEGGTVGGQGMLAGNMGGQFDVANSQTGFRNAAFKLRGGGDGLGVVEKVVGRF